MPEVQLAEVLRTTTRAVLPPLCAVLLMLSAAPQPAIADCSDTTVWCSSESGDFCGYQSVDRCWSWGHLDLESVTAQLPGCYPCTDESAVCNANETFADCCQGKCQAVDFSDKEPQDTVCRDNCTGDCSSVGDSKSGKSCYACIKDAGCTWELNLHAYCSEQDCSGVSYFSCPPSGTEVASCAYVISRGGVSDPE